MGTRADYYIGTGPDAEWLGSTTFDGYPDGCPRDVLNATTEAQFRIEVELLLSDHGVPSTRPNEGWPWPWKDSRTTDYAYAWCSDDAVRLSSFGRQWETIAEHKKRIRDGAELPYLGDHEVRDMSALKADHATVMAKSGLIVLGVPRSE